MTNAAYRDRKFRRRHDIVFPFVNTIVLVLLMFATLYPVINTIAYSFNDGTDALKGGITGEGGLQIGLGLGTL